jgi:hypothetical protein
MGLDVDCGKLKPMGIRQRLSVWLEFGCGAHLQASHHPYEKRIKSHPFKDLEAVAKSGQSTSGRANALAFGAKSGTSPGFDRSS